MIIIVQNTNEWLFIVTVTPPPFYLKIFDYSNQHTSNEDNSKVCVSAFSAISHTITCSIGMWLTRPDTTVRFLPSPRFTSSTYRVSASGCFFTSTICPTLKSRRDTSSFSSPTGSFLPFLAFGSTQKKGKDSLTLHVVFYTSRLNGTDSC